MNPTPKQRFHPGGVLFLYAISIVLIDQLTKTLIGKILTPSQSLPVIKSVFHITLVLNKGGAFGIFANAAPVFIFISVAAISAIALFLLNNGYRYGIKAPLAFIMAGAISNLIDRLRFGYVIDFLDFRVWPVFNFADTAITAGTFLLLWNMAIKRHSDASGPV